MPTDQTLAYIGLGSNLEDPLAQLHSALRSLQNSAGVHALRHSRFYRSRAVGFEGDDFINLAAAIDTDWSAWQLRSWLRELETRHGRLRDVPKFSDRTLDVDILLFGDRVSDDEDLPLPRPEILRFAHVLRPLAELAPDVVYPGRARTLLELWEHSGLREVPLEPIDPGFLG